MQDLLWGFAAATAIAVPAWKLGALDISGAIAAIVAGSIIFGFGGWAPSAALIAFFISGSILSHLPTRRRLDVETVEPQGRTWKQVAANGLLPTVAIVLARFSSSHHALFELAFYGSIAAACADSWATEIGTRLGRRASNILSGETELSGISGGISLPGLAGSVGGGLLIAMVAALSDGSFERCRLVSPIILAGILAALADSVLGASIQARYKCQRCGCFLETQTHCDQLCMLMHGFPKVKNNTVNFAASAIGALLAVIILDLS